MNGLLRALALAILLASLAAMALAGVSRAMRFEGLSDYGEGTVLAAAERFDRQAISPDWFEAPEITLAPYGPGYYGAVRAAARLTPWRHSLIPGRLVSLLATWGTALLIGLAAGRASRSLDIGLGGAVVFLASPIVHTWGGTHRVDALATFFAVASCLAAGRGKKGLIASALLIVAGSFVKQTVALSAAGVLVWLLLERRPRDAVMYVKLVAGLGLSAWWLLDRSTGGYYFASALAGNLGRMSLARGIDSSLAFLSGPLAVAAVWVVWRHGCCPREEESADVSRYVVGFVTATVAAGAMASKEGSAPCYFLEASALAALVFARHGLASLAARPRLLLAGLAVLGAVLAIEDVRLLRQRGLDLDTQAYGQTFLAERLSAGDRVLADGQHLPGVLAAGARPALNDPFYFRQMADRRRVSTEPLVETIERGEIAKLVLKQPLDAHRREVGTESQKWPARVLDAMESRFVLEAEMPGVFVYRLDPSAD